MDKTALVSLMGKLDVWAIVAGVAVAIGVVGESIVGFLHWRSSNALHVIEETENLSLRLDIANAKSEAEAAKLEAAHANERAEAERLERVKLEERLAPRRLTEDQATKLLGELSPHAAGAQPVAFIGSSDVEPATIGKAILDTMRAAGWRVTAAWGKNTARAVRGIVVEVRADAGAQTRSAATAFVEAIRALGLGASDPQSMESHVVAGTFSSDVASNVRSIEELQAGLDATTIRISVGPK